jgi:hypothetical protein
MSFPAKSLSALCGRVDTNLDSLFSLTMSAKRREYEYSSLGGHCELLYIASVWDEVVELTLVRCDRICANCSASSPRIRHLGYIVMYL